LKITRASDEDLYLLLSKTCGSINHTSFLGFLVSARISVSCPSCSKSKVQCPKCRSDISPCSQWRPTRSLQFKLQISGFSSFWFLFCFILAAWRFVLLTGRTILFLLWSSYSIFLFFSFLNCKMEEIIAVLASGHCVREYIYLEYSTTKSKVNKY